MPQVATCIRCMVFRISVGPNLSRCSVDDKPAGDFVDVSGLSLFGLLVYGPLYPSDAHVYISPGSVNPVRFRGLGVRAAFSNTLRERASRASFNFLCSEVHGNVRVQRSLIPGILIGNRYANHVERHGAQNYEAVPTTDCAHTDP